MNTPNFWKFFEADAYPKLGLRQNSLRYVFEHLDRKNRPVFVVETGCVRGADNWAGDGQSTILFDRFVSQWPGSVMYSVDINPAATALCKTLVSSMPQIHTGDSVPFVRHLARNPPESFAHIDVLYLDSYDVDLDSPHLSALHHMKELVAASSLIGPDTLVVVDDAPSEAKFILLENKLSFVTQPQISGKAKYVADYAKSIGLKPVFGGFQAGWIGL
jgi:hypothetical protein